MVTAEGKGEVAMFTTNPVWRWQNMGEYRMIFNTLMNFRNLAPAPVKASGGDLKASTGTR